MPTLPPRTVQIAATVGAAYGVLAAVAIVLTRLSGGIALMWIANGVLVGALCVVRLGRRPAIIGACFVACSAATIALRYSSIAALGFSLANCIEGVVAVALLERWSGQRNPFEDVQSVLLFALAAGIVAPGISGMIGAATAGLAFGLPFAPTWLDWWFGHGLGTLIVAPLVVLVTLPDVREARRRTRGADLMASGALFALVAVVSAIVFGQNHLPLMFLPAFPMLLATFRMGRIGAAGSLVIVATVGGVLTMLGRGPVMLVYGDAAFRLQFFQFYLGTLFVMALPAAASLTRQRKLHARLQENEAALRLLADHSTDVLLNLDIDGRIRFASPSVRSLGGYDPDALVGRNAVELIEPRHHSLVKRAHLDALAAPETNVTVEYEARRRDGSVAWFETNTRAVRDDAGQIAGVVSAIRDVSHRKSVECQLRLAADTDPLTGLANRRPFMAALEATIASADDGVPAVVALLDLDYFKRVNDRFGHAAGDAALVQLAGMCRRELRAADTVARLGGEEFGILLGATGLGEAEAICERLRQAIAAQPIIAAAAPLFRVTASFGLAEVTAGAGEEDVLAAADRALYAAKDAGRNLLKIAA